MKHPLSIQDIVMITGKSKTTIFRYIKKGKLKSETQVTQGNTTYFVEKEELEQFLNREVTPGNTHHVTQGITPDNIQAIVKDTIDKTITQMARPMEEQALFIAGKLSSENQFLKERLETLRQENELLREQVKALPDLQAIQKETEEKQKQIQNMEELHRQELQQVKKEAEDEQKNYLATIEELKNRLQAEEKKPWYRKLFS